MALPALIVTALGYRSLPGVLAGGLLNPDSYMRMVRLRETLAWHRPAYVVTADASGHGTLLHWSHLLDSLVVLLAAPLSLFLSPPEALHAAAMLAGPLGIGGLGLAIVWAAAPFVSTRDLVWLAPVLVALSPAVAGYAMPGVLHHHVPIIVAAVMAGGYAARIIADALPRPGDAIALGAWAGAAIWLTPEVTPLLLLIFGGLWLAWISAPPGNRYAKAMVATGATFLLVVTAAWAVDPPYAGYGTAVIDRVSILFVGLGLAVLGSAAAAMLIDRLSAARAWGRLTRIAAGCAAGCGCFGVWIAAFPMVLRGPGGLVSAADWRAMLDSISEMQPVHGPGKLAELLVTGALAAVLLAWLAWRQRSLLLAYAALCAGGLLVVGQMHVRFAAYPETLAAIMLPIAVYELERAAAQWRSTRLAPARLALIAAFLAAPLAPAALASLPTTAQAAETSGGKSCAIAGLTRMLAPYAGQVVLADVNDTPELLYRTGVLTVGSLYHRDVTAFLRLRAAWRSGPAATVPPTVTATQASLVLFCPSRARSLLVSDLPRDTLADRLNQGIVPPWLRLVATDEGSGNRLYRIVR